MAESLVFIVDDDKNILNVMEEMLLCLDNIRIKIFTDASFLEDPELPELDLLIIDNHLDLDKSGVELALEGNKTALFPVLIISGYILPEKDENLLSKLQIYDFIEKPMLSIALRNRARLLLSGMKYTHQVIRDKQVIENRFWAILKNIVGVYLIFTDSDGNILYSDNSFVKDIGFEDFSIDKENACKQINIKDFLHDFDPAPMSEDRQEMISVMYNKNGDLIEVVKCFTWYINQSNHQYLTLAFPVLKDNTKVGDSLINYYGMVIKNDRDILDIIKKVSKVGG